MEAEGFGQMHPNSEPKEFWKKCYSSGKREKIKPTSKDIKDHRGVFNSSRKAIFSDILNNSV